MLRLAEYCMPAQRRERIWRLLNEKTRPAGRPPDGFRMRVQGLLYGGQELHVDQLTGRNRQIGRLLEGGYDVVLTAN
jgi:hypothetical protein